MNTFRHPASAKIITIFFGCMLAAISFNQVIESTLKVVAVRKAFVVVLLAMVVLFFWALSGELKYPDVKLISGIFHNQLNQPIGERIKSALSRAGFYQLLLLNLIIQLPFVVVFYLKAIRKQQWQTVSLIGIVNSVLISGLLMPFTVVKKDRAGQIASILQANMVNGFALPDLSKTLAENSKDGMRLFNEIGTLNMYNKKMGRVDYRISPSNLLTQNEFWFNKDLRNTILGYPLIYVADSAIFTRQPVNFHALSRDKKYVFIERISMADSINAIGTAQASIKLNEFTPNNFKFTISTERGGFFSIAQNYHPYWRIKINGKTFFPEKVNTSFMGFLLQPGTSSVEFIYRPTIILIASLISLGTLFLLLGFVFIRCLGFQKKYRRDTTQG